VDTLWVSRPDSELVPRLGRSSSNQLHGCGDRSEEKFIESTNPIISEALSALSALS